MDLLVIACADVFEMDDGPNKVNVMDHTEDCHEKHLFWVGSCKFILPNIFLRIVSMFLP